MYPAQALGDGLYTNDDLPDVVVINELNYSKLNTPEQIPGENSTIYYKNSTENIIALTESFSNFIWEWFEGLSGGGGVCLIDGYDESGGIGERLLTFDQFADTYTVAWNISDQSGSSTATRQSLCIWTFTALNGEYLIEYESVDFFRWRIVAPDTEIFKAEPSFENTPTGYYETGNQDFTVS
jgi:hypothetical protein